MVQPTPRYDSKTLPGVGGVRAAMFDKGSGDLISLGRWINHSFKVISMKMSMSFWSVAIRDFRVYGIGRLP